jgi:hypothetical protein
MTLAGTLACIALALLLFGTDRITSLGHPPIYIAVLGLSGSLALGFGRLGRIKDAVFAAIIVLFVFAVLTRFIVSIRVVPLLIYSAALIAGVLVYARWIDARLPSIPLLRSLVVAGLAGVFYLAATAFHGFLFGAPHLPRYLFTNMPIGFLIGLGIGLGEEIVLRYERSQDKRTSE